MKQKSVTLCSSLVQCSQPVTKIEEVVFNLYNKNNRHKERNILQRKCKFLMVIFKPGFPDYDCHLGYERN